MMDDYYMDFQSYSLNDFKTELNSSYLIPSRQILKEHIEDRFKILKDAGAQNLQDLSDLLKTPRKTREFSMKSGLPDDYLLILRREVNSYHPKPVNLEKFPGIKKDTITKLNNAGIKNTAHLFKRVKKETDRKELSTETGVKIEDILELTKLTDLSRVKWIGSVFARIFLDSGTDSVKKLSKAKAGPLYEKLVEINQEKDYTKAKFVENDVELCIKVAKMVPQSIEF